MNKNPIEILPSSRSIRARIMDFQKLHTSFLPDFMTMYKGSFFARSIKF